jgi:ribosomal-protein-alanine N-acetyltransferase
MSEFTLRPMTAADISEVFALECNVYEIDPWSLEQVASEVAGIPRTRYYVVAEKDGKIIGYAGLFSPAIGVEADIQTVTVATEFQGRGIGRDLMMDLLDEATRRSAPAVLLEVRLGNDSAIHLYESCGFVEIARRPNYYGQDLHALVMRKPMSDIEAMR